MWKNSFEFAVRVNGKPLREYNHHGKVYVEGRNGSFYDLFFKNNTWRSVEVVFSVDGLDVLDGKDARTHKPGYIVRPWSSLTIPGWRLDNESVAKFGFGGTGESYAASTGKPRNVGVIGAAVFFEKRVPKPIFRRKRNVNRPMYSFEDTYNQQLGPVIHESSTNYSCDSINVSCDSINISSDDCIDITPHSGSNISCSQPLADVSLGSGTKCSNTVNTGSSSGLRRGRAGGSSMNTKSGLGTVFGKRTQSSVVNMTFNRESSSPDEVFAVSYNNREGLEAIGIPIAKSLHEELVERETAVPFEDLGGGCNPPHDWEG